MSLNGDLNLSVESKYGHGELIKDENYHILNYGKYQMIIHNVNWNIRY